MPSVAARDIDFSDAMKDHFDRVRMLLISDHGLSDEAARAAVGQFFTIDVAPLERVLAMHTDARRLAANLAGASAP